MKYINKLFTICFALLAISACTDLDEILVGEVGGPFNGTEPAFGNFDGGGSGPADAVSSAYNALRDAG